MGIRDSVNADVRLLCAFAFFWAGGKWGGVGRSAARSVGIKKLACVCHDVLESVRFTCVIGSAIVNSLNNVEGCWLT